MATEITINAVAGGYVSVPLTSPATAVQLDIVPAPGVGEVIAWTLFRPRGSTAVLTATNIKTPLFSPDVEGTYRLYLTIDGVPDAGADAVCQHIRTGGRRVPAQGETTQASTSEGWAIGPTALATAIGQGVNDVLDFLARHHGQGDLVLCRAGAVLAVGNGVRCSGQYIEKSGLPGQETIPIVLLSTTAAAATAAASYGVIVEKVTPTAGGIAIGEYCLVQRCGPAIGVLNTAAKAIGDYVYYQDAAGTLGFTPGTVPVIAGVVSYVNATGSITVNSALTSTYLIQRTHVAPAGITQYQIVTETGVMFNATLVTHKNQFMGMAAATVGAGASFPLWHPDGLTVITNAAWAALGMVEGDALYADPTVPGGMTKTEPIGAGPYCDLQVATAHSATSLVLVQRSPIWVPA